jgi:predicted kinase
MAQVPLLMIILGTPASGKTTLGGQLAADLKICCFCKDDVKEALFESLGAGSRDWSRKLSDASFAVLSELARGQLNAGMSCILEGNWRQAHAPGLLSLAERGARTAQVWCRAEPGEIVLRFTQRRRHPGHLDDALRDEVDAASQSPPAFLELPGPRWVYASDDSGAYPGLLRGLQSWGL